MASPQIENGKTEIANELMDALCRIRIPGEERQILDCIFRKTYGWHKKEDAISLSQFAEMTGMNKPHIIQSIKGLLLKKVIIVTENGNAPAKVYKINKDYDQWQPLPKKVMLPKTVIRVTENSNPSLPKTVPTKTTTTKATITKAKAQTIPGWIPEKTFLDYQASRKRKLKPASYDRFFKHLKKLCDSSRASPEQILNQSIVNGWEGIFELKTGGLIENTTAGYQKPISQVRGRFETERERNNAAACDAAEEIAREYYARIASDGQAGT